MGDARGLLQFYRGEGRLVCSTGLGRRAVHCRHQGADRRDPVSVHSVARKALLLRAGSGRQVSEPRSPIVPRPAS